MNIFLPPPPLDGETRQEWEARALRPWRMEKKRNLLNHRGWKCERCGARSEVLDLDEGIVPRSSMRGLPLEKRRIAFGLYNLFILCPACNREEAHQQEWAFERSCQRYGESHVRAWYASIEFKAPEWRFMP